MRWVDKYNKNKNITRKRKTSKEYKVKKRASRLYSKNFT